MRRLLIILTLATIGWLPVAGQAADKELLGRALDYFQGAKYHECMLILSRLDSVYTLNPRFRAFLGVCYYHEAAYDKAAKQLTAVMDDIEAFAPQERTVYRWTCAESLFTLQRYQEAIPHYEAMLAVCRPEERADALYRLGFCSMYTADWHAAEERLESAIAYYNQYRSADREARLTQAFHMLAGIRQRLKDKP